LILCGSGEIGLIQAALNLDMLNSDCSVLDVGGEVLRLSGQETTSAEISKLDATLVTWCDQCCNA
jgi:hypothetical protein